MRSLSVVLLLLSSCGSFSQKWEQSKSQQTLLPLSASQARTLIIETLELLPVNPPIQCQTQGAQLITNKFEDILKDSTVPEDLRTSSKLIVSFYPRNPHQTLIKIEKQITPEASLSETSKTSPSDGTLELALIHRLETFARSTTRKH